MNKQFLEVLMLFNHFFLNINLKNKELRIKEPNKDLHLILDVCDLSLLKFLFFFLPLLLKDFYLQLNIHQKVLNLLKNII
jgi:hypothetical protein